MTRRTSVVLILAAVALGSVACAGSPSPTPSSSSSPASEATQPSTTALPYAGAPKVTSPLPASVLSGDPCASALTPQQITQAVGPDPELRPGTIPGIGPKCSWSNTKTNGQVLVAYDSESHTGLSGVYQNTQPKSGVWKVLPAIQGYPAVAYAGEKGTVPKDYCHVAIGLADDLSVDVYLTLGRTKVGVSDPCEVVPGIAELVLTTLRAKAGA
ncbi:DUF3558 domain-containing protein [Amycolatopsis sp. H20-H5]|uniref:DUF3558 domain-containing protein n=1 Tax=Amycolatopsis sp. H20-H5 TaxID=3046309 RepID=UPI002DBB8BD2|nr:DUF3558 domain-containing protein [Amycolatopsis sp. H20-H5]MEC3977183.1 DUF3558 domain-containing protein [Amycolatopsis sp. H20-H5]